MAPILLNQAFKATTPFVDAFVNEHMRHMKLEALMQTEIPVTSGRSNLKGGVELFHYDGILFHTAVTGFVQ